MGHGASAGPSGAERSVVATDDAGRKDPNVLMRDGQEFAIVIQNRDPLHYARTRVTVNGSTSVSPEGNYFVMPPGSIAVLQRPYSEQRRLAFAAPKSNTFG